MAYGKEKINFGGQPVEGTPIEPVQSQEYWNKYVLDDGSELKIKLVIKKVLRVDGQYDPEGNPLYFVQSTNILTVKSPEELRKDKTC